MSHEQIVNRVLLPPPPRNKTRTPPPLPRNSVPPPKKDDPPPPAVKVPGTRCLRRVQNYKGRAHYRRPCVPKLLQNSGPLRVVHFILFPSNGRNEQGLWRNFSIWQIPETQMKRKHKTRIAFQLATQARQGKHMDPCKIRPTQKRTGPRILPGRTHSPTAPPTGCDYIALSASIFFLACQKAKRPERNPAQLELH